MFIRREKDLRDDVGTREFYLNGLRSGDLGISDIPKYLRGESGKSLKNDMEFRKKCVKRNWKTLLSMVPIDKYSGEPRGANQ